MRHGGDSGCCEQAVRQRTKLDAAVVQSNRPLEVELRVQHAKTGVADVISMTVGNRSCSEYPS